MKSTDAWVFLLPPGWARFPTGEGRDSALDAAIKEVVAKALPDDLPRDRAEPLRRMSRERLRAALIDARQAEVSVVYLPIEPIDGVVIPASITEVEFTSDAGADPLEVITEVLADDWDESEELEIDGRPAARVSATAHDLDQGAGLPLITSTHVVYAINRDEEDGAWLAMSFSVISNSPNSHRLAEALTLFFDAVMTTFRWAGGEAADDHQGHGVVPGSARIDGRT